MNVKQLATDEEVCGPRRIDDDAQREADRLLYLHFNGGGGNPNLHLRLAALLRTERKHYAAEAAFVGEA